MYMSMRGKVNADTDHEPMHVHARLVPLPVVCSFDRVQVCLLAWDGG